MPTFLDGQQNLAALTVPGVYGDIILPTPLLVGVPTNIEGLIGVGSWGPTNSIIPVTQSADCAISLGTPLVRTYDIATHVAAATQVGGSIGFFCIRVTDGTDTAAAGTIIDSLGGNGITLTGRFTGIKGNQIQVSVQQGSLINSYMAVVSFPGVQPEQFNNIPSGAANATGSVIFSANPANNTTLTFGGTVVTFVNGTPSGNQVKIGGTLGVTLNNLILFLNGSADINISQAVYNLTQLTINVLYKVNGTVGNGFALATNVAGAVLSGTTLTGGSVQGNGFWVTLTAAINSGNAFHGPSLFVTATAGSGIGAPILSSPINLTGGTDGASGVTDATLMGQDVLPRKGAYALRSTGVDAFTTIDLSTISYWAALGALALSENALCVVASPSGTSYQSTITARNNAGVDTPWIWIIAGDWPTFFDSFNSLSRLVNPTAFAIGILGNLSPQQSPLNKPLQGISSTQTSALGTTYGQTDLSLINTSGIDVILPATQSPGGFYYSFATGRNASSNTAANGIEYTRMTDFLIRTATSTAAGSFVGRLQSIQPTDQTRQQATDLFNGLSAQLASSQVGLGINGQGIIDKPWNVQCNLVNNPPNLQALGYLFLYWQVRYLNVVRYFVIKFQGGGNVNVTIQSTQPSAAQFAVPVNVV
jgi:hypothetical protein